MASDAVNNFKSCAGKKLTVNVPNIIIPETKKENRKVFGEVYFVREQTLEMIDFYENEGVLFRRKRVMLSGKLKGDVYVYYDCDNPCDLVLNRLWNTDLKKRVWYAGARI